MKLNLSNPNLKKILLVTALCLTFAFIATKVFAALTLNATTIISDGTLTLSPATDTIINGNVGIGTPSPGQLLDVNGISKLSGVYIGFASTNGISSGSSAGSLSLIGGATSQGGRVDLIGGSGTGSNPETILFYSGNGAAPAWGEHMRLDAAGNLGIGITTPTAILQAAQGIAGLGSVSNSAGGTTVTGVGTQFLNTFKVGDTITVGGQTVAISTIASDTSMTTAAITSAHSGVVYTLAGGTRFSVLGNGNVGIGTIAPERSLHVVGNGIISERSSGSPQLVLRRTGDVVQEWQMHVGGIGEFSIKDATGTNTNPFIIEADTLSNTLYLKSNGSVGIGTTTPTSKLQVVGIPVFANNAAAIAGGLTVGAFYRTGADPDPLMIVH